MTLTQKTTKIKFSEQTLKNGNNSCISRKSFTKSHQYKPFPVSILQNKTLNTPQNIVLTHIYLGTDQEGFASITDLTFDDGGIKPWHTRNSVAQNIKSLENQGILYRKCQQGHNKILGFQINHEHPIFKDNEIVHHVPKAILGISPKDDYYALMRHYEAAKDINSKSPKQTYQSGLAKNYEVSRNTVRKYDARLQERNILHRIPFKKYKKTGHFIYKFTTNLVLKSYSKKPLLNYFKKSLPYICTHTISFNKLKLNNTLHGCLVNINGRLSLLNIPETTLLKVQKVALQKGRAWDIDRIRKHLERLQKTRKNIVFHSEQAQINYLLLALRPPKTGDFDIQTPAFIRQIQKSYVKPLPFSFLRNFLGKIQKDNIHFFSNEHAIYFVLKRLAFSQVSNIIFENGIIEKQLNTPNLSVYRKKLTTLF